MTQRRQEDGERNASMQDCLARDGWDTQILRDGSFRPVGNSVLSEEQTTAYHEALGKCYNKVIDEYGKPLEDEKTWRAEYARMLDTRRCLSAYGYETPEPPSEDAWVARGLDDKPVYNPFAEVMDDLSEGLVEMDSEEYYDLAEACVQAGDVTSGPF